MSQELQIDYTANLSNVYACVFYNDSGTTKVRNLAANTWDSFLSTAVESYDIPMTESGHGLYTADFPTTITTAATYTVVYYSGDKAGDDDTIIDSESIVWDGSAEYVAGTDIGQLTTVAQFKQFCGL